MIKIINRRYTKDAAAPRASTWGTKGQSGGRGKVVALDIKSGQFEVGDNAISAAAALRVRVPGADIRF